MPTTILIVTNLDTRGANLQRRQHTDVRSTSVWRVIRDRADLARITDKLRPSSIRFGKNLDCGEFTGTDLGHLDIVSDITLFFQYCDRSVEFCVTDPKMVLNTLADVERTLFGDLLSQNRCRGL